MKFSNENIENFKASEKLLVSISTTVSLTLHIESYLK